MVLGGFRIMRQCTAVAPQGESPVVSWGLNPEYGNYSQIIRRIIHNLPLNRAVCTDLWNLKIMNFKRRATQMWIYVKSLDRVEKKFQQTLSDVYFKSCVGDWESVYKSETHLSHFPYICICVFLFVYLCICLLYLYLCILRVMLVIESVYKSETHLSHFPS